MYSVGPMKLRLPWIPKKIKATLLLTSRMGTRSWVNKTTSSVRLGRMDERILKLHRVLSSDQSNWMIKFKKTFLGKRFLKNLQPVISGDFVWVSYRHVCTSSHKMYPKRWLCSTAKKDNLLFLKKYKTWLFIPKYRLTKRFPASCGRVMEYGCNEILL